MTDTSVMEAARRLITKPVNAVMGSDHTGIWIREDDVQSVARALIRMQEDPVFNFLMGSGPLKGRWFGDPPPDDEKASRPRPFWWRSHLRAALSDERGEQKS